MIEDAAPVNPLKPSNLDPGVGVAAFSLATKQQQPSYGGDAPALMARHQAKRLQIGPPKAPKRCERLGSRSEVDRFRVEIRNWLLIVGFAASESAQLRDQLRIGSSIGRAHADVDTGAEAFTSQIVGPNGTGMHLDRNHVAPTPSDDLQLGDQSGSDVVADQIRQTLFEIERLLDSAHMVRPILDADEHGATGGVGEGHEASQHALGGREIALELEGLSLGPLQELEQIHELRSIL